MKIHRNSIIVETMIVQDLTFEDALESFFKCPSCSGVLNLKKNDKSKKAFAKQVDKIRKEMQS